MQKGGRMKKKKTIEQLNTRVARKIWTNLTPEAVARLRGIATKHDFSVSAGELIYLNSGWYVTHTGLIGLARRRRCCGIHVEAVDALCDSAASRFVLKATVFPSKSSSGFVGYGDADPSNVSSLVRGAEMRVAETRAVNRALRKAYGIGLCSVEEIGTTPVPTEKFSPEGANGNRNGSGPTVRDRLCQLIRQHKLDPELVKAYAVDFCGTKTLRDASREQVENFVRELADWAEKDRNALICQLNSYERPRSQVVAGNAKCPVLPKLLAILARIFRTASSSCGSMVPSSAGTRPNRFMFSDYLLSNRALCKGSLSWVVSTARKRRCGNLDGSSAISCMPQSFWPTNKSTRRLCPDSVASSRSLTP